MNGLSAYGRSIISECICTRLHQISTHTGMSDFPVPCQISATRADSISLLPETIAI
jgi:hypothetical protein